MTKDKYIAELEAQIAELKGDKRALVEMLQLALSPKERSKGAIRQANYMARKRHNDRHNDASLVTQPLERVTLPTFPSGDVTHVTPDPKEGSKTHSGPASQKRHSDALDHDRAEQDAAKHGLVGAAFEAELQHFTDYWDSAGWKRKSGPVKDRNATFRTWLDSPY